MDKSGDCAVTRDKSPAAPSSAAGTIDVWRFTTDGLDRSAAEVSGLLSPDETLRAQRFHFAKDRDRFTLARGSLRIILGGYLDIPPARVEFCYGKAGKPSLLQTMNPLGLRFNLSHSGGLAVAAVAWGRELGVDIEQIRAGVDLREIATRFFSPAEAAEIFSLPDKQQPLAFFNCWTRKEAYVKATGEGLSFPLDSFEVSVKPDDPARLNIVHGHPSESKRWELRDISPAPSHVAALAVEGTGWEICFRNTIGPVAQWPAR